MPTSNLGHHWTCGTTFCKLEEKSEFTTERLERQFDPNLSDDSDGEIKDEIDDYLGCSITVKPELTSEAEVMEQLLALRLLNVSAKGAISSLTFIPPLPPSSRKL